MSSLLLSLAWWKGPRLITVIILSASQDLRIHLLKIHSEMYTQKHTHFQMRAYSLIHTYQCITRNIPHTENITGLLFLLWYLWFSNIRMTHTHAFSPWSDLLADSQVRAKAKARCAALDRQPKDHLLVSKIKATNAGFQTLAKTQVVQDVSITVLVYSLCISYSPKHLWSINWHKLLFTFVFLLLVFPNHSN